MLSYCLIACSSFLGLKSKCLNGIRRSNHLPLPPFRVTYSVMSMLAVPESTSPNGFITAGLHGKLIISRNSSTSGSSGSEDTLPGFFNSSSSYSTAQTSSSEVDTPPSTPLQAPYLHDAKGQADAFLIELPRRQDRFTANYNRRPTTPARYSLSVSIAADEDHGYDSEADEQARMKREVSPHPHHHYGHTRRSNASAPVVNHHSSERKSIAITSASHAYKPIIRRSHGVPLTYLPLVASNSSSSSSDSSSSPSSPLELEKKPDLSGAQNSGSDRPTSIDLSGLVAPAFQSNPRMDVKVPTGLGYHNVVMSPRLPKAPGPQIRPTRPSLLHHPSSRVAILVAEAISHLVRSSSPFLFLNCLTMRFYRLLPLHHLQYHLLNQSYALSPFYQR